ncbi:MAG: YggS family pyridoxal phosphate-dependent enzyme [Oscillospiraceae bacterium]|nr:YggS family pyridoxal phosphate-dependent enzyme [Oscillospiraceae bacterium]
MSEKLLTDTAVNVKETFEKIEAAAKNAGRDSSEIRLMAVTKTVAPEKVNEAVEAGCFLLGENKVQELLEKYESYDKRAEIHFIGTLQTNKVKYIVDKVSMIESVDSLKLAEEIEKRCAKIGKTMDILLEVNIADEESKSGFSADEVVEISEKISEFSHLRLRGLMTIGKFGAEIEETRQYFEKMRHLLVDIRAKNIDNIYINILSMGMSADYELAVSEGATIVRVGRGLFGARKYV